MSNKTLVTRRDFLKAAASTAIVAAVDLPALPGGRMRAGAVP
ncbi:MAG: twin-arginine translocation signal domain-containing protein [Candidatus Xenobiia bacterium LiM19]